VPRHGGALWTLPLSSGGASVISTGIWYLYKRLFFVNTLPELCEAAKAIATTMTSIHTHTHIYMHTYSCRVGNSFVLYGFCAYLHICMKNMLTRKLIIKFSKTLTMSTIWRLFYSNKNLLSDVHMCEYGCGSVCKCVWVCVCARNIY